MDPSSSLLSQLKEIDSFPLLFCAIIGGLFISKTLFSLVVLLKQCFLPPTSSKILRYLENDDCYAVVTGASDGIGKEFSIQLAKAGFNLVIMSRSKDKLDTVAKEVKKFGRQVIVYPFDFSSNDGYDDIQKTLEKLKITVLINNVGVSHDIPTPFSLEDDTKIEQIVTVNISSVLKMTKLILPKMTEQKKGLVLNMGSYSGIAPVPYLSVYGASKAFLQAWSEAVALEVENKGVHVELLNTMYVATAMAKIRSASLAAPSPDTYVSSVLKRVGVNIYHTPYFFHNILTWITVNFLTKRLTSKLMGIQLGQVRQRALKKRAKSK